MPSDAEKNHPVILQVLPALQSGGVERGTVEIAKAIADAGMVSLVASSGGKLVEELEKVGAKHIKLPLHSKNPLVIWRNIKRLEKIIKEHGVNLVHARSRAPAWSAYCATQHTGVHFVTTFHGTYNFNNPLKKWYNSIMVRGERVIAISEFIRDHIREEYDCAEDKIRLIQRGADLEQFNPDNVSKERVTQVKEQLGVVPGVAVITLPGRVTRWKGQDVLVEALVQLRQHYEPFQCLLVGDYGKHHRFRTELEKKIKQYGLDKIVKVTGNVQDMPALYMFSDVVVSASTEPEAFGRVAVEAQAMGRLVVATNHGGSKETVLPGKTGWLVEPGNPESLALALSAALLFEPQEEAHMAQMAREHVWEHFSVAKMCERTLSVYRELL